MRKVGLTRALFTKVANATHRAGGAPTNAEQSANEDYSQYDITGEDSFWRMSFRDKRLEKVFRKTVHKHNIQEGLRMLLMFTVFWLAAILAEDVAITQDDICRHTPHTQNVINVLLCCVMIVLAASNLRTPRLVIYVPLLAGFYTAFLIVYLIEPSCDRSAYVDHECLLSMTANSSIRVRSKRDCSMVGTTSVQMLMTVVLLSPYFVPRLDLTHLLWAWLACILCKIWVTRPYVGKDEARLGEESGEQSHEYYSDLEVFNRVIILIATSAIAVAKKRYLVKSQRKKFIDDRQRMEASHKLYVVLECMVPFHVIAKLVKNPHSIIAEPCSKVSILFIMIVDFDQYVKSLSPQALLAFLNVYFQKFDNLCQDKLVTKVETVSEEYVAAVGVVPEDKAEQGEDGAGHSAILGRLIDVAVEIFVNFQGVPYLSADTPLQFKMGIHTGPVVAGVIGHKLPRFRLFGDTINTSARMMQKGIAGKLQMGEQTFECLPPGVPAVPRGPIEMKGKGMVNTFLLDVGRVQELRKAGPPVAHSASCREDGSPGTTQCASASAGGATVSCGGEDVRPRWSEAAARSARASSSPKQHASGAIPLLRPRLTSRSLSPVGSAGPGCCEMELTEVNGSFSSISTPGSHASTPDAASLASLRRGFSSVASPHTSSMRHRAFSRRVTRRDQLTIDAMMEFDNVHAGLDEDGDAAAREAQGEGLLRFRKTLDEILGTGDGNEQRPISERLRSAMGFDMEVFTPAEEEQWMRWFHETVITKKFAHRVRRDLWYSSVFALVTMVGMLWTDAGLESHPLWGGYRFEACLLANVLMALMDIGWWCAADSEWLVAQPASMQRRFVATTVLKACCIFVALEAVSVRKQADRIKLLDVMHNLTCWVGDDKRFNPDICDTAEVQERLAIITVKHMVGLHGTCPEAGLIFALLYFLVTATRAFRFNDGLLYLFAALLIILVLQFKWPPSFLMDSLGTQRRVTYFGGLYYSRLGATVFLCNSLITCMIAFTTERNSRARYKTLALVESTRDRIEGILHTLMPERVIDELSDLEPNEPLPSHSYERAIIAQSDLCGFTKLASTRPPSEVIQFISEIFGRFDALTDLYDVYKVETVGDAYIAGQAGWPLTRRCSAVCVINFGLDMIREVHKWSREHGEELSCRVAVHLGSCIGGIVGVEMQRYHLFGDLMNVLELLESTSEKGKVQVSSACCDAALAQMRQEGLPSQALQFDKRIEPHLTTSKGDIVRYDEVGGHTYLARGNAAILRDAHRRYA